MMFSPFAAVNPLENALFLEMVQFLVTGISDRKGNGMWFEKSWFGIQLNVKCCSVYMVVQRLTHP